jgi:hypothetical protein
MNTTTKLNPFKFLLWSALILVLAACSQNAPADPALLEPRSEEVNAFVNLPDDVSEQLMDYVIFGDDEDTLPIAAGKAGSYSQRSASILTAVKCLVLENGKRFCVTQATVRRLTGETIGGFRNPLSTNICLPKYPKKGDILLITWSTFFSEIIIGASVVDINEDGLATLNVTSLQGSYQGKISGLNGINQTWTINLTTGCTRFF